MSQLNSLLLVLNASDQLDAIVGHLASVRPGWVVRTEFSVQGAKAALQAAQFDIEVIAARLPDGLACDLVHALERTPAILCFGGSGDDAVSCGPSEATNTL